MNDKIRVWPHLIKQANFLHQFLSFFSFYPPYHKVEMSMKVSKNLSLFLITMLTFGCQTVSSLLPFGEKKTKEIEIKDLVPAKEIENESANKAPEVQTNSEVSVVTSSIVANKPSSGQDLKLAKVWLRLDELEREVMRQKERIFLLEKGLMTGIPPEELMNEVSPKKNKKEVGHGGDHAESDTHNISQDVAEDTSSHHGGKVETKKESLSSNDPQVELDYERDVKKAVNEFNSNKYGTASTLFEKIGSIYPIELTKSHHIYWIGLCWYNLKDYNLSSKTLKEFLTLKTKSEFVPKAKFYLAMSEGALGRKETKISNLNELIKDFPNDEIVDSARNEIGKMKDAL